MIRHLPVLMSTVIPGGGLLLIAYLLRPDPDWLVKHRPRADRVRARVVIARLSAERWLDRGPVTSFGPVNLTYPDSTRRTLRAWELTR